MSKKGVLISFDLLDELTDYFQQRADVKDGSDGPRPNREMLLQGRLESEVIRPARTFTICEDHEDADWNQPAIEGVDCILCRLFYLEAQESLLEEWQQRAKKAEDTIAEIHRPLDAQMARLNETVTRLNEENERLRSQSATATVSPAVAFNDWWDREVEGGLMLGSPRLKETAWRAWQAALHAADSRNKNG